MKLLTLNTHSIIEPQYENKLSLFVDAVCRIKPDIIALQEVNQTVGRNDNHAFRVQKYLSDRGIDYYCEWVPIKCGYKKFDEGIAVFSLSPITEKREILLSKADSYTDWRTRKAIGIKVGEEWFYSVHFGWWNDEIEPFQSQWNRFEKAICKEEDIWVLGDFNCPADVRDEGYDYVVNRGWLDCYKLAENKDDGFTVRGKIAGWDNDFGDKRIDYIFTNKMHRILSTEVVFNGINQSIVSDHFGVLVSL